MIFDREQAHRRPRLLDLFCGAGGAAVGYHRAGFDVVGVDIEPQPNYPFEFHQADALEFPLAGFDAIHASPPCQAYSVMTRSWNGRTDHPELVAATRERIGNLPYVIENVPGAPIHGITLCGSSFGLAVRRHRVFESNVPLMALPCAHHLQSERAYPPLRSDRTENATVVSVTGNGGGPAKDARLWSEAMGIDWMTKRELAEAIPPAYTEHIGQFLLTVRTAAA